MTSKPKTIVVIGATGTIGEAVAEALERRGHKVHRASRSGSVRVDIEDPASIEAMFDRFPDLDAVVNTAGRAAFGHAADADDAAFELGLRSKLMGQVNLVRIGARRLRPEASLTLTSGILGTTPGPNTAPVALVNAGVEGFVRAAAKDLADGPRVNVVSPPFVRETALAMGMGPMGMPAAEVAQSYVEAVEGSHRGRVIFPHESAAPPVRSA